MTGSVENVVPWLIYRLIYHYKSPKKYYLLGSLGGSIGPGKRNDIVCVFSEKHFGAI